MKNITTSLFALLILATSATAQQKAQQYAIKSGVVSYELTGNTTGTKTVYWDNYGTKTRTELKSKTVTKIFGMKSEEETHSITVIVEDKYWVADLIAQTGTKGTLPYYEDTKEYAESMTEAEQKQLADDLLNAMGGERLGNENVMEHSCEVISIMGAKSWIYKGIILKSEAKIMGIESNEMATEFKPNTSVSASKFTPYDGVDYDDIAAMAAAEGNPFAAMAAAMDMQEEEEEEDEIVPLRYSYEKFKSVTSGLSYPSYSLKGSNTFDGQHMSVFMKGASASITIMATSRKNIEREDVDLFTSFTHKGKKCHYGEEDDGSTALIIEYPSDDMYIVIAADPSMPKQSLLNIHDQLSF